MLELFIYKLFTKTYHWLIRLAAIGSKKARLWIEGRKKVFSTLKQKISIQSPKVWFHCASLGEFEQARPVLEAFKKEYPHFQIILTFFSPSGYEVRKNYPHADIITYLPEDSPNNAQKFLDVVSPVLICWTKYEFWHFYLQQAHQRNVPIILFSAIFRENQLFFRKSVRLYKNMLHYFCHIFVQDLHSLQLLKGIGISHCSQANDTRFDRVWQIVQESQETEQVKQFKNCIPLLIVGSAWLEDWQLIKNFLKEFKSPLKVIVAPHEISSEYLNIIEKDCKEAAFFSKMQEIENIADYKFLIVDTMGHLSALYRYADFAWVGGGFKQGLHNILEAATFGMPIFFGNKAYQKFKEAQDLISLQGAFAIADVKDFIDIFSDLYSKLDALEEKKNITQNYIRENIGGSGQIMKKIRELLNEPYEKTKNSLKSF
ncbi:MAG: glycosyltransferase N-terminal domain-containing protein [Raineya sp.]